VKGIPAGLGALVALALVPAAATAALPRQVEERIGTAAADPVELELAEVVTSHGVRFYRLRQEVRGLPVFGAEAVVTDARGLRSDVLVDDTRTNAAPARPRRVSRRAAIDGALEAARVADPVGTPDATLGVLPQRGRGQLVWRVVVRSRAPLGEVEAMVDASSGEVVRLRDLLREATGSAAIFDPNPVVAQGSRSGLSDSGDADSSTLTSLRTAVTLERLTDDNFCLQGQWAWGRLNSGEVCDSTDPARDWSAVTRSPNEFEALMAYFHVDRAQAYIQSLGFTNVLNQRVRVNANAFTQDNSFYSPSTGQISLGSGGTDDGEDAEVITHEYGHAVQDDQVPGFGESDQGGAMGEGFSDYLAGVMTNTFTPSATFDPCVAEWDELGFGNPAEVPCLRRLDTDLRASQVGPGTACDAEVHCAGEAWSAALWDIRAQIGATTADRLVIQSHFGLTPQSSFHDGSRSLLAADGALYGGVHQGFLRELLASRELLDVERLDDVPADATALGIPGRADGRLAAGSDVHDYYRLSLEAGRGVLVRLTGGAGNFDIRLRPASPSAPDGAGETIASSTSPGSNETLVHVPSASGTFFLDVSAASGTGTYVLEALPDADGDRFADSGDNCPANANPGQEDADGDRLGDPCDPFPTDPGNDADGDGLPSLRDNCPDAANPNQADWDGDRRGDACDRSARATIDRVSRRGRRLTIRGRVFPPTAIPSAWRLLVDRRSCRPNRCRYVRERELTRARTLGGGRVSRIVRVRRGGLYRLTAILRDPRFATVRSAARRVRVR